MSEDVELQQLTVKMKIAINALLSGAMATGKLRVRQKGPDLFHLQAEVSAGTFVTINAFDFNATAPLEDNRQVETTTNTGNVEEEISTPENVVPFKPLRK